MSKVLYSLSAERVSHVIPALLLVQVEDEGLLAVGEEVDCSWEMLSYVLVLLSGVEVGPLLGGVLFPVVGDAEEVGEELEVLDLPLCCQVEDVGLEVLEQSAVPVD